MELDGWNIRPTRCAMKEHGIQTAATASNNSTTSTKGGFFHQSSNIRSDPLVKHYGLILPFDIGDNKLLAKPKIPWTYFFNTTTAAYLKNAMWKVANEFVSLYCVSS